MKKENKFIVYTLLALPLILGGYFIYKSRKRESDKKNLNDAIDGSDASPNVKDELRKQSEFPLKKGSKGAKVEELQQAILIYDPKALPKFGADADFGSETEAAVRSILKKATVDNQEEISKILEMAAKEKKRKDALAEIAATNAQRNKVADAIISFFNKNRGNSKIVGIHDTQYNESTVEVVTGRKLTDVNKVLKAGQTLIASPVIVDIKKDASGFITIQVGGFISRGTNKFIRVSPFGVYIK